MLQIQGNLFARKKLFLRISKSGSNGKGIEEFNYDFGNTIVSNFLNDISKKKKLEQMYENFYLSEFFEIVSVSIDCITIL